MASGPSWVKVASGFNLVALAAGEHLCNKGGKIAARASQHGVDLANVVHKTSMVFSHENKMKFEGRGSLRNNVKTKDTANHFDTPTSLDVVSKNSEISKYDEKSLKHDLKIPVMEQNQTDLNEKLNPDTDILSSEMQANSRSQPTKNFEEGSPIPVSRFSRALNFASLGLKLTFGTAAEATSRLFNYNKSSSIVLNDSNADILAASLCRMRGAALKIGQMLSIQDESVLPPALTRALEQVRAGADAMPRKQLKQQLDSQLSGNEIDINGDWESKYFEQFDWTPIAAASLGQVHKGVLKSTGKLVAIKVQYPGVANSIESDLKNMSMLITMFGFVPKGLFLDNIIRVGREELLVECDYRLERKHQERFRELVNSDEELRRARFVVPKVIPELCTEQILTTEFAPGGTIDKVSHLSQSERNRIGRAILRLTMLELFSWRFMQTDPNWGNFLHDVGTATTYCIDFGAAREYSEDFVKLYCNMIWAAANRNEEMLMDYSRQLGFIRGDENEIMMNAHRDSGFTIGEPFNTHEEYDFGSSQITKRIAEKSAPFLHHRLT